MQAASPTLQQPELICIDPARVREFWPHAQRFIKSAIERTDLSRFDDIERAILDGKSLLWLAWNGERIEAAASTELCNGSCVITACGGSEHKRWIGLLNKIEQYASDEGCKTMRIIGRNSWRKILPDYRQRYVILEKVL